MPSFASDFAFIGARDYVHGPTFFEAFRDRVLEVAGLPATSDFSFRILRINQPVHANGTIVVTAGHARRADGGRPAAEMACFANGTPWTVVFHDRGATPITRRVPPQEKDFVRDIALTAPFTGTATLAGIRGNGDLFQAVVEANKQVHLKTLLGDPLSAAVRFRFAYCLDYRCAPSALPDTGEVDVRSEGLRRTGAHEFSLTTLTLRLGDFRSTFKLCFASRDMENGKVSSRN